MFSHPAGGAPGADGGSRHGHVSGHGEASVRVGGLQQPLQIACDTKGAELVIYVGVDLSPRGLRITRVRRSWPHTCHRECSRGAAGRSAALYGVSPPPSRCTSRSL